jgi:hypothetical protein
MTEYDDQLTDKLEALVTTRITQEPDEVMAEITKALLEQSAIPYVAVAEDVVEGIYADLLSSDPHLAFGKVSKLSDGAYRLDFYLGFAFRGAEYELALCILQPWDPTFVSYLGEEAWVEPPPKKEQARVPVIETISKLDRIQRR